MANTKTDSELLADLRSSDPNARGAAQLELWPLAQSLLLTIEADGTHTLSISGRVDPTMLVALLGAVQRLALAFDLQLAIAAVPGARPPKGGILVPASFGMR